MNVERLPAFFYPRIDRFILRIFDDGKGNRIHGDVMYLLLRLFRFNSGDTVGVSMWREYAKGC